MAWTSSDAKTLVGAFLLAGSAMEKMTVVTLRMSQKKSVLRGRVSRTSSDVRTTAVSRVAGSVITTMIVVTTQMKISVCLDSVQKVSSPAPTAAVLLEDGSAMETMIVLMDLMSMAVL